MFYRMVKDTKNYYGSLCTELYEILHKDAPEDELNFYLSYAKQGMKILEPLCGSGRFFIPFMERQLNIFGVDLSKEMLQKLIEFLFILCKTRNENFGAIMWKWAVFHSIYGKTVKYFWC